MTQNDIAIELLDTNKHDRTAFASGVEQVDNFLQKTAGKLMKGGTSRVFVALNAEGNTREILGFYSINAHSVDCDDLPNKYRRYSLPGDHIPAAFIGMMGVATHAQGRGIGSLLLADALKGAYQASLRIGTAVVLLDILDCGHKKAIARRQKLYESFGFQHLSLYPLRMFLPVATIAQLYEKH